MLLGEVQLVIDEGSYQSLSRYIADILQDGTTRLLWVYDSQLQIHVDEIKHQFKQLIPRYTQNLHFLELSDISEKTKSLEQLQQLWEHFAELQLSRSDVVLACGGGIVGDLVGFASSTYLRGLRFIQFPTSLLAMIDASYGGKTAINTRYGKNQIGSFYRAECICICPQVLRTLPQRELRAALAEWVKYKCLTTNLCTDYAEHGGFYAYAQQFFSALMSDPSQEIVQHEILGSLQVKHRFVQDDLHDQGLRQCLNFGHSFAHALEAAGGFIRYNHGEALAVGTLCALKMSLAFAELSAESRSYISSVFEELMNCYQLFGLPLATELTLAECLPYLISDKKRQAGKLNFVYLEAPAQPSLKQLSYEELSSYAYQQLSELFDTAYCYPQPRITPPTRLTRPLSFSKSLLHRALFASAMLQIQQGRGSYELPSSLKTSMLYADDVQVSYEALQCLLTQNTSPTANCAIDCKGSGTTARFLAPIICQLGLDIQLEGDTSLSVRDFSDLYQIISFPELIVPLQQSELYLPLKLGKHASLRFELTGERRVFQLEPKVGSQHISGLLYACAIFNGISELHASKPLTQLPSWDYIALTVMVLRHYGVKIELHDQHMVIHGSHLVQPQEELLASDVSQDIFWTAYAALHSIELISHYPASEAATELERSQADFPAHELISSLLSGAYAGKEHIIALDRMPDAFPVLAICSALAPRTTITLFTQLERLSYKESDRLQAIVDSLSACAVDYELAKDRSWLRIHAGLPAHTRPVLIDSYADHRIAMAVSLLAVRIPVIIRQASSVRKSFPDFWRYLERMQIEMQVI